VTAEWFRHLASSSVLLFVAGLAITGYGMGVFFAGAAPTVFFHGGGSGVHFIALGLVVVVAGVWLLRGRAGHLALAGVALIVYILMLLGAIYAAGDW